MTPPSLPPRPPKKQDRPLALVNARIVDPASNRDETGGVLVENGIISAIGSQVTRANALGGCGGPRLPRPRAGAGPDRHARAAARAGRGAQGDDRDRQPGRGGGRRHLHGVPAQHRSGDRRRRGRGVHRAARARDPAGEDLLLRRADPGPRRHGSGGDGAAGGLRRARLHRRPECGARRAGDAPRPHLRAQLRCAGDPASGRAGPRRRRRHEQRRVGDAPRHSRHPRLRRSHDDRARPAPGARVRRALPRRACLDRGGRRCHPQGQAGGPAHHLRYRAALFLAERDRDRRLPHLRQAVAAAARRARPARDRGRAWPTA